MLIHFRAQIHSCGCYHTPNYTNRHFTHTPYCIDAQVCSAAKDGTCKVWDVTYTGRLGLGPGLASRSGDSAEGGGQAGEESDVRRKPLQDIPCCVDGIAGAGSAAGAGGKNMMQCRGCRYCQCVRIYICIYVCLCVCG
jgi:hypothetical protein